MASLETTNLLLGIMTAVSVIEALVLACMGIAAFRVYRDVSTAMQDLEREQIAPTVARVNAMIDDAQEVRRTVRARVSPLVGLLRGVRVAWETLRT